MKLVKQLKLFFQEGASDKVYEIDLCESGDGFLVNFRYGRRGAALKEGTKTIFPVALQEAEKVFSALEQEKRKKGYVAAGEAPIITTGEATTRAGGDKRKKAIVKLLKAAAAGEEPEHWPISRIIWRAGDLKIKEAIPYIIQLADPQFPENIYSVVWSIGRCGTSSALGFLQNLQQNKTLPDYVQHLVQEAILKLGDQKDKEVMLTAILESLPRPFRESILAKDHYQFRKDLEEYLFGLKTKSNDYLVGIYQLTRNDIALHAIFLDVLHKVKFEPDYFKHIRRIFKTAEMLQDYSTYAVIAKQFEKQLPQYKATSWMNADQKKQRAFSKQTKEYLTRRVTRQLRKYGEAQESSYVELASEILLAFSDVEDLKPPFHTTKYNYVLNPQTKRHTREETKTHFDSFSEFRAFNFILFQNSTRYRFAKDRWVCTANYTPGNGTPPEREEAYPALWNNAPTEIIELLARSKTNWVQEFALKVWKANPSFEQSVETPQLIALLASYALATQSLALGLARKRYNAAKPETVLLIALLESKLAEARHQGAEWINASKSSLLQNSAFVISLLKMKSLEAHAWLRGFLTTHTFTKEQAEIAIASLVSFLITSDVRTEEDRQYVNQVGDTLIISFGEFIQYLSLEIVKDLFKHPSPDIHAFAGKILMKHAISPEELPEDFLTILLTSGNVQSRGLGISLLGKFPDALLLQKKDVLVSFCLSPLADVRDAVRPLILRLTKSHPQFGRDLVNMFVPAFLIKEAYEGVHEDLLNLLSNELADSLHVISAERTLVLLNSRFRTSQLIGNILLKKTVKDSELTIPQLVKLSANPIEEVRKYARDAFGKYPEKVKASKEEAVKMTDTDWDDTRLFAFGFFRETFGQADWSTDLLIALCDSTREDVQNFAREMITKFFEKDNGTEYLLKLSQHPSSNVQLFTTAYLQEFAAGKPEVLSSLKLYFITLLSQVNKGRIAKQRIFSFLHHESLTNERTAQLVAEILSRVSASVAVSERAACISALRDIRKRFPNIESPITVKEVNTYVRS